MYEMLSQDEQNDKIRIRNTNKFEPLREISNNVGLRSQELEVRSLIHLYIYSHKTKSSQCHYVMTS